MRIRSGCILALCTLSASVPVANSQASGVTASAGVPHQPYMAEYKLSSTRMLPNGTSATMESAQMEAVDTQGRKVTVITPAPIAGVSARSYFHVADPVSHVLRNWVVPGTNAQVVNAPDMGGLETDCSRKMKARDGLHPVDADVRDPPIDDLGTATIKGVAARGGRIHFTTTVQNAGGAVTYKRTNEVWTATDPALDGLKVRVHADGEEHGNVALELMKLTRGEPDPALFQIPKDRTVSTRNGQAYPCNINRAIRPEMNPETSPSTASPPK